MFISRCQSFCWTTQLPVRGHLKNIKSATLRAERKQYIRYSVCEGCQLMVPWYQICSIILIPK